ncbi:MAG: hypothetical protein ACYC4U_21350 [Pirellulaceae bacterium]
MTSPTSSHRQLSSWRGAKTAPGRPSSTKWMAMLVVIGLFALFGWLLWLLLPSQLPQTHVVAIATGEAHKFIVPPLPFTQEQVARLAQTEASSYRFHDFSRFQEADNIRDLGRSLQSLPMEADDVLVVYVSAHGVADDGTAYLLCRDYDLQDKDSGRYAVSTLLDQLKQSPAATKLLVLDAPWILSDARLGMLVNEFPALVADEVARQEAPDLWVLLSCSLLQRPTVLFTQRQTLFGRGFADGLKGDADLSDHGGNEDGFISLEELFHFLVTDCRLEAAGSQMPVLLHAGQQLHELTQIPPGIRLARSDVVRPAQGNENEKAAEEAEASKKVSPPEKNALPAPIPEKVAEASPRSKSAEHVKPAGEIGKSGSDAVGDLQAAQATTGETNTGDGLSTVRVDQEGTDVAPKNGHPKNSDVPLAALLHQAWQARDRLDAQFETAQWGPLEYAPQQWRELNALLLDIDLRSRAGEAFDQTRLRGQLMTQLEGLHRLEQGNWLDTPIADRSLVVHRLLISASRFADSAERASFTTESRELREVGEAVRYFLRLSFRLPDYTRCYAETIASRESNPDLLDMGRQLKALADGLLQFQAQLQNREGQRLVASATDDSLVVLARNLRETEDTLQSTLQNLIGFLAANADQPLNRDRIAGLLLSPVWTASQRQKLAACLDQPLKPPRPASLEGAPLPQQWTISTVQWERIAQLARLQAKQFELAGASDATALEPQLGAFDAALRSAEGDNGPIWQAARAWGQTCESLQLSLRQRVVQEGDIVPTRWLDARDAHLLASSAQRDCFPALRLLPPRQPDRIEVTQRPPDALRIDKDPVVVEIEVQPSNPDVRSVSIAPEFDAKKLHVQLADEGQSVPPGRPLVLQVDAERTARLRLQIKTAAGFVADVDGGEYPVRLTVTAGALSVPYTLQCAVPKPNEVDLVVERIDPSEQARRFGRNGTELRPLVNRTTYFRFSLVNLSGQAKQVDVALYRIPDSDWTPGRLLDEYGEPFAHLRSWLFQTDTDRLLPGIEAIASTSASLSLPADTSPREVDFSPKPAPPAGAPESSEPTPSKEPVPPPEPARVEITTGLACVITNASDPMERWVKWIEINPLAPREYVEPSVSYDPELGNITIEVRGLDANTDGEPDRFPSLAELATQPIEVVWDTAGVVPVGAERNDRALIDRPGAVARLHARVPSHPIRRAVIRLNVDGFPRAFVYELALNRTNNGRDIRRDERSIRIVSLQIQNENRILRTTPEEAVANDPSGDAKTEVLYLQTGAPAVFAVPGKSDTMLVGCEVDAPLDAFTSPEGNDVIEIGFTKPGFQSTRLHSDRQMQAWLHEVTPAGLPVSTRVGDFTGEYAVPLDITGLKNARLRVQARLKVDQDNPPPHELDVVLDGEAPVLTSLDVPAAVRQGESVPLAIDVTDMSGPGKVVCGIVSRRGDELKEDQATVLDKFSATALADRWPVTISLDSAKLQPDDYFVKVQVTDRVGKQTDIVAPITITAPRPATKEKLKPLVGTIQGVVRFGPTFHPDRITVGIKGSTIKPTTTSNGGRFRFDNVPAGKYAIEAKGPVRGYIKQGMVDIELKQKADYARQILIELGDSTSE